MKFLDLRKKEKAPTIFIYPYIIDANKMEKDQIKIYIDGVPPGIGVGIFDLRKGKNSQNREILLQKVKGPDYNIESTIDKSYGGVPVKVVIRAAGFLPYSNETIIENKIGLFHAAKLEIDRIYSGQSKKVPQGWDSNREHREAEQRVQDRYRKFKKYFPGVKVVKNFLDYGVPLLGALIGFFLEPLYGTLAGLSLGFIGSHFASKLATKAMGWY